MEFIEGAPTPPYLTGGFHICFADGTYLIHSLVKYSPDSVCVFRRKGRNALET
jgi:hypothetical protein